MISLSGCAAPPVVDNSKEEALLNQIVELQTKQEQELCEVKALTETQGQQYRLLSAALDTILQATEEHRKSFQEIRNAVAQTNKRLMPAARTDGRWESSSAPVTTKKVIGGVALIHLAQPDVSLLARVDTGAETASLDARNIEQFERDGEDWVKFDIPDVKNKRMVSTEHKLSRKVKILQSTNESSDRRLVVELPVEIAGISQVAEFTLADREHLTYPVLIGRNILKDMMVVDVALPVPKFP